MPVQYPFTSTESDASTGEGGSKTVMISLDMLRSLLNIRPCDGIAKSTTFALTVSNMLIPQPPLLSNDPRCHLIPTHMPVSVCKSKASPMMAARQSVL